MIVSRIVNGQYVSESEPTDADRQRLRDMLDSRQGPTLRTDASFLEGTENGRQFAACPEIGDAYARPAREAGVNITGAVYKHGLARFPGDPRAWVRSRGDVEAVARERGMKVEGAVRCVYTGQADEPPPDVDIAPDIVRERVRRKKAADPSLERRPAADVFAEARDEIKPPWSIS